MSARVPAIILGGTGYVAGELLRLTLAHPRLELGAIASDSQPGEPVAKAFPHLAAACGDLAYTSIADATALAARHARSAVLAAAPHGVSHALIDGLLKTAEAAGTQPSEVDISADYRFADLAEYERVYRHPHGAPGRARDFTCAVPEHLDRAPTPHVAHPGCFVTAALLAAVPLLKLGLAGGPIFVSAVTGSTGAGRSPIAGTHHPQRHSELYAYSALAHRHAAVHPRRRRGEENGEDAKEHGEAAGGARRGGRGGHGDRPAVRGHGRLQCRTVLMRLEDQVEALRAAAREMLADQEGLGVVEVPRRVAPEQRVHPIVFHACPIIPRPPVKAVRE